MKIIKQIEQAEFPENYKELPPMEQLKIFWPVICLILSFVEVFTGPKADAKIEAIKQWGDEHIK